ncbi:MAG: winged helix-turn-helix domain-containing protein [Candidatus Eremiobacteraeota bacterium]|nr:winged helix-turn-helix domain-containing protein [Candidatus Eremiobacteraeota bacterium]
MTLPIGSYSFDPENRLLRRQGKTISLPRKAAELLAVLLADGDALVPRERIFERVWPEGFVHESNLTQTTYLLRKALAADPAVRIENVPRRGYRLRVLNDRADDGRRWHVRAIALAWLSMAAIACIGAWIAPGSNTQPLSPNARQDVRLAMYHFDRFANLKLARSHFMRTTQEAPSAPDGYAGLALVDAIEGYDSPQRARRCLQGYQAVTHADALGPSTLGHVARAMLYVTCERSLVSAKRELDAALAMNHSDPLALAMRSRVAFWENDPRAAVAFASNAISNDPTSSEALLALGIAYYYDGSFRDAVVTFKRLLELMPGRTAALEFLAYSYEAIGDFTRADAVVRTAQRDPDNASWAWAAQARLLARRGHPHEALALLRTARYTSDPDALSAAYAALGDDVAAIKYLGIAASRHSLNTQVSWLSDVRFATLRRQFPNLTPTFVAWR